MAQSRTPLRIPFVAEVSGAVKAIRGLDQDIDKLNASVRKAQESFKSAGEATDQGFDRAQDAVVQAERAMQQLGIKSEQVADNQIARLRQAFEQLRSSGAASAAEIGRAYENMQDRILRINAQVGRGVDGLGSHYRTLGLRSVESAKQQIEAAQRAYEAIRNSDAGPEEIARAHAAMQAEIKRINASIGVDIRELEDHYRALGVTSVESAKKQAEAARQAAEAIRNSGDASPEDITRSQEAANEKIRKYYASLGMDVRSLEELYQSLGITSTEAANKQIEAARKTYEAIANSDAPIEDVARAWEAYQAQVKAANASIGKDIGTLEDHYRALGVTSVEAAKKQAEAARQAAEAIKGSKDASPEDVARSQEAANEKIRQYYAALGMDVRTLEELYKSLGVTSTEAANQQIEASRKTYEAIKNSDAPIEDVTRAWEAHEAQVKAANASIGKDVRTLEDHYRELGVVSEASAEKQIAGIRETADTLRASASGPKELARITKAEGERIKAVYTSIGVHAKKTFEEVNAQIRKVGEGMRSIGSSMSWRVTAPIMLGFSGMMKVAGDFEQQMNAVRATLRDVSDKEFADLNKQARDLGASTRYSAMETAAATKILASAGLDAKTILGGALKAVVDVAATSDAELTTSAELITQATSLFGISANKLGAVANDVAGFMDASKFSVTELSQAIAQGAGVAKNAGLDFQQFAAVLSLLEGQGFSSGSDAGTSMKNFFMALMGDVQDAEKQHSQALKKLAAEEARVAKERVTLLSKTGKAREAYAKKMRGIDQSVIAEVERTKQATLLGYEGMKGGSVKIEEVIRRLRAAVSGMSKAQRDSFLKDKFGSDSFRVAVALIEKGADGYLEALGKVRKGDAATSAAMRQAGFKGQMEELGGALQELALTIADSGILKTVTEVVRMAADFVRSLAQTSPGLLKFATYMALAVAVIGPLLMGLGQMAIGAAILVKAFALVGIAIGGVSLVAVAMAAGIFAAIGVVAVAVWHYRDEIMNALGDAWRWIKENAASIGWWILETVSPITAAIWEHRDAIIGAMSAVWGYIKQGWSNLLVFLGEIGSFLYDLMIRPWIDLYNGIIRVIGNIKQGGYSMAAFFRDLVGTLYDYLVAPWVRAYEKAKKYFGWMISMARKAASWMGVGGSGERSAPRFATGGIVRGPGTGTSDSIMAWLSDGEGIIRARAVRHYGEGLINQINALAWSPAAAMAPVVVSSGGGHGSGLTPITLQFGQDAINVMADRTNYMRLIERDHRRKSARSTQRKPEL